MNTTFLTLQVETRQPHDNGNGAYILAFWLLLTLQGGEGVTIGTGETTFLVVRCESMTEACHVRDAVRRRAAACIKSLDPTEAAVQFPDLIETFGARFKA